MASIFRRVKTSFQPKDGYIPVSVFTYKQHSKQEDSLTFENIGENLTILAIEYLLQIHFSESVEKKLSILESALFDASNTNKKELIKKFYDGITSENSLTAASYAVKLAKFEAFYRSGVLPESTEPDIYSLESIGQMADRCKGFFNDSLKLFGFDFEGGYTTSITNGNGGYMTNDTLWNITASHSEITEYDTLLVLVQYIMGLHSYRSRLFGKIKQLGIYNPRLCKEYTLSVSDIPKNVIQEVSKNIIGYNEY